MLTAMLGLEQLAELLEQNRPAARARVKEFTLGGRHFAFNSQPAIMGVINLSADSWYRESVCLTAESAVRRGRVMHAQGADLVDVGRNPPWPMRPAWTARGRTPNCCR